jgi:hypothetical protein
MSLCVSNLAYHDLERVWWPQKWYTVLVVSVRKGDIKSIRPGLASSYQVLGFSPPHYASINRSNICIPNLLIIVPSRDTS